MPPASAYQPQESRRAPAVADLLPLGVMTRLLFFIALFIGGYVFAETIPGYRHPIEVLSHNLVSDDPKKSSLLIKLKAAPPLKDKIQVLYDTKSGRIFQAVWMTKGGRSLPLPAMGAYLPPNPAELVSPVVILSAEKISTSDEQKIIFLTVLWDSTKQ
jgi:hypothetical protein